MLHSHAWGYGNLGSIILYALKLIQLVVREIN